MKTSNKFARILSRICGADISPAEVAAVLLNASAFIAGALIMIALSGWAN